MNLDELIAHYVKVRDAIEAEEKAHKTKLARAKERLKRIEDRLMQHFSETGQESARTKSGTAYRSIRTSVKVDDREAYLEFVRSNQAWGFLESRACPSEVTAYLEERGEPPPGISVIRSYVVKVNRG